MRILAIGAHGDDIELACGGTLAKAINNQHEVKMLVVTGKGSKSHKDVIIRTDSEARKEVEDAASILGVTDVTSLNYDDTNVPYSIDLISDIENIIIEFNPDMIFTHFVFDTHQDHIRTAHSTLSASRRRNNIYLYEPINPSGQGYVAFRPQLYSDISSTIEKKISSLQAHKSQLKKYSNKWLEAVEARAKYRGYEIGVDYAECFEIVRTELDL